MGASWIPNASVNLSKDTTRTSNAASTNVHPNVIIDNLASLETVCVKKQNTHQDE